MYHNKDVLSKNLISQTLRIRNTCRKIIFSKTYPPTSHGRKNDKDGTSFESFTLQMLRNNNINEITNRQFSNLLVNFPDEIQSINGISQTSFCYQPNGSQSPPDFIFLFPQMNIVKVIYLEQKSSNKVKKPVWNCSLPVPILYEILN